MNRQQRRKAEKQGKEVKKEPVINIKKSDIRQIAEKATEKAMADVTDIAFLTVLALPLYVLKVKYGFGKKRLSKFMDEVLYQYECISQDYVTLEDMRGFIKDETGIEILDAETIKRLKNKERQVD